MSLSALPKLSVRRRLGVALATVAIGVLAVAPAKSMAYAGDGSNPASCSSPTNLATRTFSYMGSTVGQVQLRFSDPCNTSWVRICGVSGWYPGDAKGERFQYPAVVGPYTTTSVAAYTNCGGGSWVNGLYTYAWFNDCAEAGLGSCRSRASGSIATNSGEIFPFYQYGTASE